ncbi:MAG: glycosyltransferase family 1 protein [Parcubacteria group bacterium]|jgi:glycosyltransferase involved in cell wall biosynthesis
MKIGIDIRLIGKKRTGDEAVFFNLVKNLAEIDSGNQYFLFSDRDPKKDADLAGEIKKLNLKDNFKIIFLNSLNRFCWNLWTLSNYLRKNGVDVFHTQYIAPFWLPKKVKLVLTIHDISFSFFPEYIKKSDLFFLKTLIPRSIRRADKIITVSQSEKKNIIDFYKIPPEKIDCAYNGVDFERFSRAYSAEEKENIRKKYTLPEKFLLYIGTLQPRKNIPSAIEALKDLDMPLVLAGNRQARNFDPKIDEAIKKYNLQKSVIFPGWIDEDDKPALLQMAECFVFPSLYEGFGIPVIEAMAAGTPVVCSDIPVLREIGKNAALFCEAKNSREFAENILKILADENFRNSLIEKGKNIAQNFTWQKTAEKTLKIYEFLG